MTFRIRDIRTVCTALEARMRRPLERKKLLPMTTAVRVPTDQGPIAYSCTDALPSKATRWPGPLNRAPPPEGCIKACHTVVVPFVPRARPPRDRAAIDKNKSRIPSLPAVSLAVSLSRSYMSHGTSPALVRTVDARFSLRDLSEPPDR
jgi:hypothetical protein